MRYIYNNTKKVETNPNVYIPNDNYTDIDKY